MASYRREMSRERYEPMSEAQLEVAWMVVLLGGCAGSYGWGGPECADRSSRCQLCLGGGAECADGGGVVAAVRALGRACRHGKSRVAEPGFFRGEDPVPRVSVSCTPVVTPTAARRSKAMFYGT